MTRDRDGFQPTMTGEFQEIGTYTPRQRIFDLAEGMGFSDNGKAWKAIAKVLGEIARNKPYSRRYVLSVVNETVIPGKRFVDALDIALAKLDDVPICISNSDTYKVLGRKGKTLNGAYIRGEVIWCAGKTCSVRIVKDHPCRKYCPDCAK